MIGKRWRSLRNDGKYVVQAWCLLSGIRMLLPVFGLKRVRRALRADARPAAAGMPLDETTALRALRTASRYCPFGTTCLTRAIAGQVMLRRAGVDARLCVGVMRSAQHGFQAHAWIEKGSTVIIGGSNDEIRQWTPLRGVDERTA